MTIRIDRVGDAGNISDLLLVVFDDGGTMPGAGPPASGELASDATGKLQEQLAAMRGQPPVLSKSAHASAVERATADEEHRKELRVVIEELDNARAALNDARAALNDAHAELQAANEELISINHENQYRVDTLAQLSNDLQHLLDSTGLAALLVDGGLRVVRVTTLASALLRLEDGEARRPLADFAHLWDWGTLLADVRRVLEGSTELQREVQSADGRWFLVRGHPYRTALRGLEGVALMFMDISERKRAELALRESNRRKEEFLAVLAHELRNPLAPITAGLEVLRMAPEDSVLRERVLETMTRQTRQLVRLVDDLLEVGRINEGKVALRMQPVPIADVVRDALAAVRPLTENLEQQVTVELPVEPLWVEGDAVRLTQVIGNLLHNSARYTPSHGKIALCVRRQGEEVEITVQDNGRGMSAEALENAFEMFYQARESALNGAGLGIGLTLAKKLVEMHRGSISAASPGVQQGSKFTVRLSLAPHAGEPAAQSKIQPPQAAGRHRVLIVDDNDDAAETLRELIGILDASEVRTASNGIDALKTGAQFRPDVVLLDLSMPGMDGYELARRMRAEAWGKTAMLVALTGWGQEQHRRRSKEAGFDRHLTKPADPDALRSVLNGSGGSACSPEHLLPG
jgi:signal transduction histidine kinase/CheY-like chemotaxis protein